jgi:small subunit ribosomal protein S17
MADAAAAPTTTTVQGPIKKTYTGEVVSNAMNKTIVVKTTRLAQHRLYKKYVRKDKKLYVHDETNDAKVGDKVEVVEVTRPLSKLKRYRLVRIVERAK